MIKSNIIQLQPDDHYSRSTSLRKPSEIIEIFDEKFSEEMCELLSSFYSWKITIGLSAPQIGIQRRIAVVNLDKEKKENTLILVNPEVISESGKKDIKLESCISIPNYRGPVERRSKILIKFQNEKGSYQQMAFEGFLARVILHEIDHLNGILYVDRMMSKDQLQKAEFKWE